MLSFGDPTPYVKEIHAAGAQLICQVSACHQYRIASHAHSFAQVQSVEQAKTVVGLGADIVVAQGSEAGGHGGAAFRGSIALVPAIVDAVPAHVPVLAAGGIADGRGVAAALSLGMPQDCARDSDSRSAAQGRAVRWLGRGSW